MNWNSKRTMIFGALALVAAVPALPQNPQLQEKLAAVKQSMAENKQKLRCAFASEDQNNAAHLEGRRQASDQE